MEEIKYIRDMQGRIAVMMEREGIVDGHPMYETLMDSLFYYDKAMSDICQLRITSISPIILN